MTDIPRKLDTAYISWDASRPSGERFQVEQDLFGSWLVPSWTDDNSSSVYEVTVEQGFRFDAASVPWWLHWRINPHELSFEAAAFHDWWYRKEPGSAWGTGFTRDFYADAASDLVPYKLNRKQADIFFHREMINRGIDKRRADLAYRAVRIFGSRWEL